MPTQKSKTTLDILQPRALPDVAKTFLNRIHRTQGRSLRTVQAYATDLERYFSFLKKSDITFKDVRRVHMENFIEALDEEGALKARSMNRTLSAVKSFYKWLNNTEEHLNSVRDWIDAPKFQKALAVPLSEEEAAQLLKTIHGNPHQEPTEIWFQDLLMVRLLYATAMRLMDLVQLKPGDLDLSENQILIARSKGGRPRWVDLDPGTKILLTEFLEKFPRPPENPLFKNIRKKEFSEMALRRYLQHRLKRYAQAAGIKKRVYPHLLRHSCAVHMLNNHADLKAIQDLLGHTSISTTQIYLQMSNQYRKKQYQASHPLAKKPIPLSGGYSPPTL
jgi:site-specific recombinase XerD